MAGTEIYIALDNTNIYFNEKSFIPIQDTNIPKEHLIFRSHESILWKVEMLEYDGASKCLRVRVVDYHSNDISAFNRQEPKKRIDKILFERFDWSNFEPLLSSYQKQKLMSILSNIDVNLFSKGDMPHIERKKMEAFSVMDYSQNQEERAGYSVADIDKSIVSPHFKSLIATKILVEFSVGISEVKFNLGYVSITKAIKEIDQIINFKISNDNILAEFDCIKYWFAKVLKTKKINVKASIKLKDGVVADVEASSEEVNKISSELIDIVKLQRTYALMKAPKIQAPDKSLFTADEIFSQFEEEENQSNAFNQSEQEILQALIDGSKIRNRKQLEYLSGAKQTNKDKLRYTLKPNFGFLFLVEGERYNHFVWELIDSNATYIWSIGKSDMDIKLQYRRIEDSINIIRDSGREQYKRAYRENHNDADLVFSALQHNNVSSNFIDGFPEWKSKLNERLV